MILPFRELSHSIGRNSLCAKYSTVLYEEYHHPRHTTLHASDPIPSWAGVIDLLTRTRAGYPDSSVFTFCPASFSERCCIFAVIVYFVHWQVHATHVSFTVGPWEVSNSCIIQDGESLTALGQENLYHSIRSNFLHDLSLYGEHALEGTRLVRPEGYCSPVCSSTLVLCTGRHPLGDG